MREPPLKKTLYWCPECNVPLIARKCGCGAEGWDVPLVQPYDIRPALDYDRSILKKLLFERFGTDKIQNIVLFNKTGGIDRNDLIIMNGERFGWLLFDPCKKTYSLELLIDALPYLLPYVTKGIIDITGYIRETGKKRLGGKKIPVKTDLPDGTVIIKAGTRHGVGHLSNGSLKIRQLSLIKGQDYADPDRNAMIRCNKPHLKNLERHAIRFIRSYMNRPQEINVSFSGGKDSTVVLELARRAGVEKAYYVNTGMEFPETPKFVKEAGVTTVIKGGNFWRDLKKYGLPCKDERWCCERLKLMPVKKWLSESNMRCITVQGNRWYESFARSNLPPETTNPYNPKQLNISPIRHWRALEVFMYIWLRELPCNPLYEKGYERVGCWHCPAMLASEAERTKEIHPELYDQWDKYLREWATKKHLPEEYVSCGFWRWKELPPKMKELANLMGIRIPPQKRRIS